MLPRIVDPNESIAVKQQVLDENAMLIKDGSGEWQSKVNLLIYRFNLPMPRAHGLIPKKHQSNRSGQSEK